MFLGQDRFLLFFDFIDPGLDALHLLDEAPRAVLRDLQLIPGGHDFLPGFVDLDVPDLDVELADLAELGRPGVSEEAQEYPRKLDGELGANVR